MGKSKRPSHHDESAGTLPRRKLSQVAGRYRERLPIAALRNHVERVWSNELAQPAEVEVVPDGCIDIYWSGEDLFVAGPNTSVVTVTIAKPATLVGVRFRPGFAAQWLRASAAELLNTHPPLAEFWGGRATQELADHVAAAARADAAALILERALLDRLDGISGPDPIVSATAAAVACCRQHPAGIVRSLLDELGCSERTLRRRCHQAFGYGPKVLHRILRFQAFLRMLERTPCAALSVLSIEAGYADQAHLAREVRKLCAKTSGNLIDELCACSGRFVQDGKAAALLDCNAPSAQTSGASP